MTIMTEIHTQDHPMITCTVKVKVKAKAKVVVVLVDLKEDLEDLVVLVDLKEVPVDHKEGLAGLHLEEEDLVDLEDLKEGHLEEEDHHLKEDLVDLEDHLEEEDHHLKVDLMEDLKEDHHLEEEDLKDLVGLDLMEDLVVLVGLKEVLADLRDLMEDHHPKVERDLMDLIKDTDQLILMAKQTKQTNQTMLSNPVMPLKIQEVMLKNGKNAFSY